MSELEIVRYGANGEGIGLIDNKVVFVPYAIKDEKVEYKIKNDNKSFCSADLINVIEPSINRVEPKCPYFYECGGCSLQHIAYNEQLAIKKQIVQNNIKKYAQLDVIVNDTIACINEYNYRNHITFAVNNKGQLGFFKNGTHDVLRIKNCSLADPTINKCIDIFNSYFFDNKLYGYNFKTKNGQIKQIDIKYVDNQLLITIIATVSELPNLEHLYIRLNCLRIKYGVYLSTNKADNTVIYGKLKHLYGIKQIEAQENNLQTCISSYSFIQVNNYIKDLIYKDILEYVNEDLVVDAYSGRGTLSAMISKKAKTVIAIEVEEQANLDAVEMLKKNNISNVDCVCGDCQEILPKIQVKVNTLVLDPPRKGASPQVLDTILEHCPQKIVYLSCSSNTLGRDLKILTQDNKYKIIKVQPYDMFPNTKEVETLVFLERT